MRGARDFRNNHYQEVTDPPDCYPFGLHLSAGTSVKLGRAADGDPIAFEQEGCEERGHVSPRVLRTRPDVNMQCGDYTNAPITSALRLVWIAGYRATF